MQIKKVKCGKILDSRGIPTIEIFITTMNGTFSASSPSGTSTGKYESAAFSHKGIDASIFLLNSLQDELKKISFAKFSDLEKLENMIRSYDDTTNYRKLGANVLYALEAAILKATARGENMEVWELLAEGKKARFPFPVGNCIGGGVHSKSSFKPDFQEFLFIPRSNEFFENVFINSQAHKLASQKLLLSDKMFSSKLNYESAWETSLDNERVLEIMKEISQELEKQFEVKLDIGVDVAASTFSNKNKYRYRKVEMTSLEQLDFIKKLIEKYKLAYVEDAFNDDAFEDFAILKKSTNCMIVGDDLTATHLDRVKQAISKNAVSGLIVKPNQNGSLLQMKKIIDLAKSNSIKTIISHRSGETMDTTIADMAVGWHLDYIKAGIKGKEREAKLKRLVEIEKAVAG